MSPERPGDGKLEVTKEAQFTERPPILRDLRVRGENGLPVQDRIPQHPLIPAVQITMQGIEIESDHMPGPGRKIEDGGPSDEILLPPDLPAHQQRGAVPITPLEDD